jgi:hypothetical protein
MIAVAIEFHFKPSFYPPTYNPQVIKLAVTLTFCYTQNGTEFLCTEDAACVTKTDILQGAREVIGSLSPQDNL